MNTPRTQGRSREAGYTLVELIIAVGLFALIMVLVAGAYLMMIALNRQAQATATGINNLSFGLEEMTREIRTATRYNCNTSGGGSCPAGGTAFFLTDSTGAVVSYSRSVSSSYCGALGGGCIVKTAGGSTHPLTDPSVNITALTFYVTGTTAGDTAQPHVSIIISGTVVGGPGKIIPFTVETGATMRGSDL